MCWFQFNLCLIVVGLLTPHIVATEDSGISNLKGGEEVLPLEQTVKSNDVALVENNVAAEPARRLLRQTLMSNVNNNMGSNTDFQLSPRSIQAPLVGQPLDAQESSNSNKVVLVLDNDQNKFAELVKPAEESLKRLTRNPDVMDDIIEQFQQLGGGVTQQLFQQVSQTAPDISKTFGQALNEILLQTNLLAQGAPGNLNFSQKRHNLSQSDQPANIDFGQLGQSLSQNFLVGATQNLFNPMKNQATPEGTSAAETATDQENVGAAAHNAETETGQQAPKNPFVGQSLLPHFPQLPQLNPFGMFSHFSALNPLKPMGSEISEVRVLPEQYSPYKISPKQVDMQTMAEMKLKAVLKEALTKKTIPILWFHLSNNHKLQKTNEDLEMEAKLQMFEQQVIAELKQLQELARMANEVKRAQLQSGVQPTTSLNTKLNLFEIPIYDITLGDIEQTLKDEHVMMLLEMSRQKHNKEFKQASTKYRTDLTGTPIKRQVETAEDALKTMGKDDMIKMMAYAYRMAFLNGHEMPWLKKKNMTSKGKQESAEPSVTSQQQRSKDADTQMNTERKWLDEKHHQMTFEAAEQQRQMFEGKQQTMDQNPMRHWYDQVMLQQQRQMMPPQMQQQGPMMPPQMQQQGPMMPSPVQQPMPVQRQMMPPQLQQPMPVQNQMFDFDMQMMQQDAARQMMQQEDTARRMMPPQIQQQGPMMPPQMQQQGPMMPPPMQQPTPGQRQMMPPQLQQPMPVQNQMFDFDMQMQQLDIPRQMMQQQDVHRQMMEQKDAARQMVQQQDTSRQMVQQQDAPRQMMQQEDAAWHMKQQKDAPRQMMQQEDAPRQMMQQEDAAWHMKQQKDAPRQMMQQQDAARRMMQQEEAAKHMKQQKDAPRQIPHPQDPPRQMMQQPMTANFDMQEKMSMQRQQQQPMTKMQETEPNAQQFQRHPVNKNTPGQMQSVDSEKPEQTAGLKSEKKTMTEPTAAFENTDQQSQQRQRIDTESPENAAPKGTRMDNTPSVGEAQAQMPENEGKARIKGIDQFFDKWGVFNHLHHQFGRYPPFKPPPVYNYYYNYGDSRYPPIYEPHHAAPPIHGPHHAAPPIYGHAGGYTSGYASHNNHHSQHPQPPNYHYQPAASHYGGDGHGSNAHGSNVYGSNAHASNAHGSNAYGSSYGGYRAATGDEEIAVMLQQQQNEQKHPTPKLTMMMPNSEESPPTTNTNNYRTNAEHLLKNHPKRLAKKQKGRYKNPAAYIIVVRNNRSKSGRSRRKRSTDYATLEPIDENSLTALRKVYKNSLKEITLNPNETPAEALMRYNAESIREALEKANKQPMEITAVEHDEQVQDNKLGNNTEHHQGRMQSQISPQLYQGYALSDNRQFVPATTAGPENSISNGRYVILPSTMQQTQPLVVPFTQQHQQQQQAVVYDPAAGSQEALYTNMISKYNTPGIYGTNINNNNNHKFLTQNPFLSMYNPSETLPYADEYSVFNQPYQLIDGAEKPTKFLVYQKTDDQPQLTYNDFLSSTNAINKDPQHFFSSSGQHYDNFVRDLPSAKTDYTVSSMTNRNAYTDGYSQMRQQPIELTNSYRYGRSQESSSVEHIIAVIKEQLVQCCNTCKHNILKGLDEILKPHHYAEEVKQKILEKTIKPYNTFTDDGSHMLAYAKPGRDVDLEYRQWLAQMSEKGYDKSQLTKQHQRDYLKDGKLNLHLEDEHDLGHEVEELFFKNNQSYKRETTIAEMETEADQEAEVVTAAMEYKRKNKNLENEDEEQKSDEIEPEESALQETKKQTKGKKPTEETEIQHKNEKTNTIDKKDTNRIEKSQYLNANKTMQGSETTTHSVYALRGQFRAHKSHPMPFTIRQGKQFANFKSINKLDSSNSLVKSNDNENAETKQNKLEEILVILHDLSKHDKDTVKEENFGGTTISSLYNATPYPGIDITKASGGNVISKTANSTNIVEKPRKLIRRRSKSCKSA